MKKQNIIFSTLFLTLTTMPVDVFADTRLNDPKDIDARCTQVANEVYNCIFNDKIEFVMGDLSRKNCYKTNIYTDYDAAYAGATQQLRTLKVLNLRALFDKENKKQREQIENNSKTDIIAAAKQRCITYYGSTGNLSVIDSKNKNTTDAEITYRKNPDAPATDSNSVVKSSTAQTITISGTVRDDIDVLYLATITAINSNGEALKDANGSVIGTKTDIDGKFELEVPADAKVKITFVGLEDKIVEPRDNLNIKLESGKKTELKEVVAIKERQEGDTCGERLITDEHSNKSAKGKYHKVGAEWICIPNECTQDYELKGNACVLKGCTNQEKTSLNASEAKYEGGKCVPVTCKDNYHLNNNTCEKNECPNSEDDFINGKCVQVRCTPEALKGLNAKEGKWEDGKCVPTKCLDDKNFKLENGSCGANDCPEKELEKRNATSGHMEDGNCIIATCKESYTLENGACINKQKLEELQKAYDEAHEKEQSIENRTLTAVTTAATGIGGMQALQGMAEQSADEDAMADMAAYIETMRCTYGDGKQVKAGPDEIELPGANDQELMNLRAEYLALAQDLKERKEALGMKPGIESETIMDRTQTGLYDDENVGITSGNYESIYRAMMLGNEKDQAKIDDAKNTSANRVKYGAIAAGAGVAVGIAGNSLINGKLGELLKSKKADKNDANKEEVKLLEQEVKALDELKKCLKSAGVKDTDKLEFKNFYPSILSVRFVYCKSIKVKEPNAKASEIFVDSSDENEIFNGMDKYLDRETISKMVGFSKEETAANIKGTIKYYMSKKQKEIDEAQQKDAENNSKDSNGLNDLVDTLKNKAGNLLGDKGTAQ